MKGSDDFNQYLSGKKLYGNDFHIEHIEKWYEEEKDGYANLGAKNFSNYTYAYHALNKLHGFNFLPASKTFNNVLGYGSAYGHEFLPIIHKIKKLTILDSSESFRHTRLLDLDVQFVNPSVSGKLPFRDNSFDLITCFGVLHHIPNVEYIVKELYRVMDVNGILLIREPTVSMGDWRFPRVGLTKNERGIPSKIFKTILLNAKFTILKERICMFQLTPRFNKLFHKPSYNSNVLTTLDFFLSKLFYWNSNYHPKNICSKIRPTGVFFTLRK